MTDPDDQIERFDATLQPSGGSDGVGLHIDADTARKYGLEPGTELAVSLVVEDGQPAFRIDGVPTGFSEEALLEFADERGWERTVSNEDVIRGEGQPKTWGHTFDADGVRVVVDGDYEINGDPINNIHVEGPGVALEDVDDYRRCLAVDEAHDGIEIEVRDSDGLITRGQASATHDFSRPPEPETVRMAIEKLDWVGVCFEVNECSLFTTLEEVGEMVAAIREATADLPGEPAE